MRIIADLHIHSHYSRATSSRLNPAYLDRWARIKGINLLGSGDCTHQHWLAELRDNFEDAEPGLYILKKNIQTEFDSGPAIIEEIPKPVAASDMSPRFVITGEISTIYKRDGKTRKVHHLIILPDYKAAAAFQTRLERVGNIKSDGRPILGLDSRDLFAMLLDTDERSLLIPAHIWTPWFSALGANSGFDSIEECYGDLVSYIPAIETGLSSDPPMNWTLSSLDRYSIISDSDAHSPDKLGREANILETELSYNGLSNALFPARQTQDANILATVEFFPEEGKYHCDGHRKCGVCLGPEETGPGVKICPVCGKALTRGVMGRVMELADRAYGEMSVSFPGSNRRPFHSLIPLKEILGELLGTGSGSKKVHAAYCSLIEKAGSEFSILMDMSIGEIEQIKINGLSSELLSQAIDHMRTGQVTIKAGYDGEYGVIRVMRNEGRKIRSEEFGIRNKRESLFIENSSNFLSQRRKDDKDAKRREKDFKTNKTPSSSFASFAPRTAGSARLGVNSSKIKFDPVQEAIINHNGERTIIIAGPGTGKTAMLAAKISRLINGGIQPDSILALSFTVKAAAELRERIAVNDANNVRTATFHSFCCSLLREKATAAGIDPDFEIAGDSRRDELLYKLCKDHHSKIKPGKLGLYIEERKRFFLLPGETQSKTLCAFLDSINENKSSCAILDVMSDTPPIPPSSPEMEALYEQYRKRLHELKLLDYDDLIAGTVRLLAAKPDILAEYQRRFQYIFVDEYQDINVSQYVLLRLMADNYKKGQRPSLWVIGDPNQAIYGFRGSDKKYIDRFSNDYPDAKRFELIKSFRCASPIINAANTLTGTELQGLDTAVDLRRAEYQTDKAEAEAIARSISRLIGGASFFAKDSNDADQESAYADTAAPSDCAILIRAAALGAPLHKALQDHGIPVNAVNEAWWEEDPYNSFLVRLRESSAPEIELNHEKENPKLTRLTELAAMLGGARPLLDALEYSDANGIPEYSNEGVHIMTIHAAKGLEFDHVFVIGLEDGILPFTLYGENESNRLDEERRLLYVAMTRARIGLHLSWAHSRNFKGRILKAGASPFLADLENIIPLLKEDRPLKKENQLSLF